MKLKNVRVGKGIRDHILDMTELRTIIHGMSNNITQNSWRSRHSLLKMSCIWLMCLVFGSLFIGFFPSLDAFIIGMDSY